MLRSSIIFLIIALMTLAGCSSDKPSNPVSSPVKSSNGQAGTLLFNISVAPWYPHAAKIARVQTIDRVTVYVYDSDDNEITEANLTKSGSRWQGSINVTAQSNMRVVIVYFDSSIVRYLGETGNVSVAARGSTEVDITVNYMGIIIDAPETAYTGFEVSWMSKSFITGYQLQEDTLSNFSTATTVYDGPDTTYTVSIEGKTSGDIYYYRSRVNTDYGYGPWHSTGGGQTSFGEEGKGTLIIDVPDLSDEPVSEEIGITFVSIPAGSFQMGSNKNENEKPIHTVTLDAFYMSTTEITNSHYCEFLNDALASADLTMTETKIIGILEEYIGKEYMELSDYSGKNLGLIEYSDGKFSPVTGKENLPVVYLSWYGAKAFASYYGWDLPTEAEWEYAARGGRQLYYATNDGTISSTNAKYGDYSSTPVNVGTYPANPYGLYDMSGNVTELCNDFYDKDYYSDSPENNPPGPQSGSSYVKRGGDCTDSASYCTTAYRTSSSPTTQVDNLGFRVVRR